MEVAIGLIGHMEAERHPVQVVEVGRVLFDHAGLAAIGSGAVVLSMTFLLSSEQVALQLALTNVIASMIALLLCITFVLSHPFFGPMALQSDPFKHSLEVFEAVDATPGTAGLSMTR